MQKRIINPAKYLKEILKENQSYYVGFGIKELTSIAQEIPEIQQLIDCIKTSYKVTGKKGPLKENIKGKMVRKQPEAKISVWKHIEYYSKRFDKDISYDREFNIWEKEKLHQFELDLKLAKTPQGELVLHFPLFKMIDDKTHFLKAGAAMNMSIVLGHYFMLYDTLFEPIIPVTKFRNKRILSAGARSISEKLQEIEKMLIDNNTGEKAQGNSYRFALLRDKKPNDVTMGTGGFNEYLMFEYEMNDLMVLENLKSGNATYVFNLETFDKSKTLDKQNASKDPSFLKRIIHDNMDDWGAQMGTFFNN